MTLIRVSFGMLKFEASEKLAGCMRRDDIMARGLETFRACHGSVRAWRCARHKEQTVQFEARRIGNSEISRSSKGKLKNRQLGCASRRQGYRHHLAISFTRHCTLLPNLNLGDAGCILFPDG